MIIRAIIVVAALATIIAFGVTLANANCAQMQAIAQACANEMAARDVLDHCGMKGQRAENVAYGYSTKEKTFAQWRRSTKVHEEPGCGAGCIATSHAANMRLPGCKGVASAQSRSGKVYWALEVDW